MLSVLGRQSGAIQHQHRRALCKPQRVYPYTILQVRKLCIYLGVYYILYVLVLNVRTYCMLYVLALTTHK